MRAALAALVVLALGTAAPAGARSDPPTRPAAAKHQTAKQRAARKRAVARHRAAVRRRAAERRKALAEAQAQDPAPATPSVPAAPAVQVPSGETITPVAPTAPADPAAPAVPLARTVGITEREFSLSLSRTTVGAGDVTVQVLNRGEDAHDLRIETLGGGLLWFFPEIPSLGSTEPTVVPMTVGTYRIFCTLPGHAELGMDKRLTVAAG